MATFTTLQREYRRTDGTVVSLPPGTIKLLEKKKSDVHVFLNKDRTKTKLVKLFLLVMLAWMVFAMQSHPDVKKTRGVISGPKAFSLFGGRKDLRHTSLEQRDMLRKQKAEERERRDVERYGATNPALTRLERVRDDRKEERQSNRLEGESKRVRARVQGK